MLLVRLFWLVLVDEPKPAQHDPIAFYMWLAPVIFRVLDWVAWILDSSLEVGVCSGLPPQNGTE